MYRIAVIFNTLKMFLKKNLKNDTMKKIVQTAGRTQLGEFAPEFAHLNDDILFGEVWSRNDLLSLRDRSLVTITSLISQGITDSSLKYHLQSARTMELLARKRQRLSPTSPSAGWPKAWAAFNLAKEVWSEGCKRRRCKSCFPARDDIPYWRNPTPLTPKVLQGQQSYLAQISDSQIPFFNVTFEPGCRNNWHTHHATKGGGQMLVGVAGRGWYQEEGKPAQRFSRHSHPYSCQREALAWCRKRQLVCPPRL